MAAGGGQTGAPSRAAAVVPRRTPRPPGATRRQEGSRSAGSMRGVETDDHAVGEADDPSRLSPTR